MAKKNQDEGDEDEGTTLPTAVSTLNSAVKTVSDAFAQTTEQIDDGSVLARTDSPTDVVSGYIEPWDRQEDESDYMWELFKHYRNYGLKRSYRETAEWVMNNKARWVDHKKVKVGLSYTKPNISSYGRKHRWRERVFKYDQEQERLYQLARSESIREMADRHAANIVDAIEGLMVPTRALAVAMEEDEDFLSKLSNTNANKLVAMVTSAARTMPNLMNAERLARGMPTEIIGGTVEHQHVVVERDQIGEVLAILGQAGVLAVGQPDSGPGEIVDAEVVEVHPVSAEGDDNR